ERDRLPAGARRLLELADANPERPAAPAPVPQGLFAEAGAAVLGINQTVIASLNFLGEVTLAFGRMLTGRARYRRSDVLARTQACGVDALGIVALISYLVGTILAFMGAV